MHVKTTPATQTDPEDRELIMSSDDEARDLIIEQLADNGVLKRFIKVPMSSTMKTLS